MSKKKASSSSGSTMTLKDFHGGSIPSDLPLPSAPGVSSDRPSSDRQIHPIGRSSWLGSYSTTANRGFDDKASFLSHPVHIGRNFDEDERKPLDAVSTRRRTISNETIHVPTSRSEMPAKFSHSPATGTNSYVARYDESVAVGVNTQIHSGNAHQTVPNAWGVRKEVALNEPVSSSRFEQVSALQKVSSGRWQSKNSVLQPNVEILQWSDSDSDLHSKDQTTHNGVNPMGQRSDLDEISTRHGEKGCSVEDGSGFGEKQLPNYERPRSLQYPEARESKSSLYPDLVRPVTTDDKYGASQLQPSGPSEVLERPKLKLLPRSKPLETVEPSTIDNKLGYQQPNDSGTVVAANELHGNLASARPSSAGINGSSRAEERPKVTLKPRTQPLEQSEGNVESERKALFGGARPRELVLKERGVDDIAISNLDTIESPNRVKQDLPQTYKRPEIAVKTARSAERLDQFPVDQRTGRDPERKHQQGETGKADTHGSSWRKDSWRNVKGIEKKQQQEQRPEPETWRKSVEEPKPSPTDVPGLRYGKAASPLELAQAFSRPNSSSTKTSDHFSSHKDLPGRNQVPFSRLTATTSELHSSSSPRHKINGY